MLVEKITSRQNPLVKRFRRARAGTDRGFLFLEGVRLIEEALASGVHFEAVAFTQAVETQERGLELLKRLRGVPCRGANVSAQVMEAFADTESPQGIAAIVRRPFFQVDDLFEIEMRFIVIADLLQDPGNLGTIVRTSEAAGATALVTTRNTVDPFNQKALRASMGSALRLPVVTGIRTNEVVSLCRKLEMRLVVTCPRQELGSDSAESESRRAILYTEADLTRRFALGVGGEAEGISRELFDSADEVVFIPMASTVESLNASAAIAVVLYEAARQRGFKVGSKCE
jgi:TrmH family RNA methyltransferase